MASTSPPASLSQLNARVRPLIATNRCGELNQKTGSGSNTREDGRMQVRIGRYGYSEMRAVFGNFYVTTGEQADTAAFNIDAAVEQFTPLYRTQPILFGAQRKILINPGDVVVSDPMAGFFTGGTNQYFRHGLSTVTGGDLWPCGYLPHSSVGEAFLQSTNASGQTYGTLNLSTTGTTALYPGWGPMGIIGIPSDARARAVILLGDSIMRGNGDTVDAAGNVGYSKGLVDPAGYVIPNIIQARDNDELLYNIDTITNPMFRKKIMWPYATHLVCNLGTNDIVAGQSLAQMQTNLTSIWTSAKAYGLQTAQMLINPRMTTPTGVPITNFASGGLRDQLNAWIKTQAGNGVLDRVIDHLSTIEGPAGYYNSSSITVDGIHMNAAGYALCTPVVTAWAAGL